MAAIGPESVAIVFGGNEVRRNGDAHYPFRQDSDFYYLTGFTEPNAVLVITPFNQHGETTLFLNPRNPAAEQWTGRRIGPERACDALGVDAAFDVGELDQQIPKLLEGRQSLHTLWTAHAEIDPRVLPWLHVLKQTRKPGPEQCLNLALSLHELRLIKSLAEQDLMRRSAQISAQAHKRAMRKCAPGLYEWQLDAEIQAEFLAQGAPSPAYPSIVGSGENACIMHYVENSDPLPDDSLVLIDAGSEYQYYAADITRTFPVSGTFTAEQRELYEIVLTAQKAAIAAAKPGNKFTDPHDAAKQVLVDGLIALGIIQESLTTTLEKGLERKFLVHRCSHWLGIDVHDVGAASANGKSRILEDGMVLTIEPGLYIPTNATMQEVDERWQGNGIRIEDDVLITKDAQEVLSCDAPKEIDSIENLMRA